MTWEEIIEKMARQLYDSSLNGVISADMVKRTAQELMKGVQDGYGKTFDTPGLGAQDFAMLQAIEQNVFVFSGFKNYQQLKETSLLLKDKQGNIRSFNDFFADVKKVDATYNRHYAEAEYNHAHNTSTMISKWQTIQAEKEALPFIRISVVMDDRTRHAGYNGLRLPADHPFWKQRFPPFDWNCRCDAVQDSEGAVTHEDEIPSLDGVPGMFKNNAGISGVVFPEHHPYYSASKQVKSDVKKEVAAIIPERKQKLTKRDELKLELSKMFSENIPVTVSRLSISSELTDAQFAARNKQLQKLFKQYEVAKVYKPSGIQLKYNSAGRNFGSISSANGHSVLLSVNFGSKVDSSRTVSTSKLRSKSRVDAKNLEVSTLTHEFAHLITIDSQQVHYLKDERLKDFMPELRTIKADYTKEKKQFMLEKNEKKLDEIYLGMYADANINEFMAEAFTEYKLYSKPSPYAVKVGKLIDKTFKRK